MNARFFRAPVLAAGAMLIIVPAVLFPHGIGAQQEAAADVRADLAVRVGASLGPPGGETRAIVVAPTVPGRLFVGTATGHIFRSDDAAGTWHELPIALGHETVVDNLLVHPDDADRVFAAYWRSNGTGGLVETHDGGETWDPLPVPADPSLRAIAMAPSDSQRLYVGGIGGVWRSDDAGATWRNINGVGLRSEFVESLAVDPRDSNHVYAGTWRQVYRTRDGGENWARIYQGMAVDRDIFSLTISPHDPDTVLAGTCNFLYRSSDAGGSWGERRAGLDTRHNRIHTIVHDPRDPNALLAGTRGALYRSTDAGRNWDMIVADITVSGLALDAANNRLYVATEERGVLVGSPDGEMVESNLGLTTARVVAFDSLPGSPRVMFAARADGPTVTSIHYSTDIGRSWQPLGVTPAIGEILALRAQPRPVNRLLVVTEAAWWSAYPGGRWDPIPAPPGKPSAVEIAAQVEGAVVAATSTGLYVAAAEGLQGTRGAALPFDGEAAPVWRAIDTAGPMHALALSGDHFIALGEGGVTSGQVGAVLGGGAAMTASTTGLDSTPLAAALDPTDPNVVYAMTDNAIYRSDDGGRRWIGLPLPWPAAQLKALAIDPARPDQVLALDYRGAIYRGHDRGEHWLMFDDDPGLFRAWSLKVSDQVPGLALVATLGHGLRVVNLDPLAEPAAAGEE
jgi:photosystem II stability/assembly factor-like uncharacterized protein